MVPSLWSLRAISERTTTGSEGQRVTRNADKLQNVALGTAPADLVVPNGRVLLPESRRIVDREIAVETDRIAAVTTDASDVTGPETTVVDAEEKVIARGSSTRTFTSTRSSRSNGPITAFLQPEPQPS